MAYAVPRADSNARANANPGAIMVAADADIEYVEFHDARLERIVLLPDGVIEVMFEHLPVYRRRAKDLYDIWSYAATLRVGKVDRLQASGAWQTDDYVSDMELTSGERHVEGREAITDTAVSGIEIRFGSGALIEISCAVAVFSRFAPKEIVDVWRGPLVGS